MAIDGFDIAVGVSPEAYSKRVHISAFAAQYSLSQDKIDTILLEVELDSYLFTFGEAQKALITFWLSKNTHSQSHSQFSQMFFQEKSSAQQEK